MSNFRIGYLHNAFKGSAITGATAMANYSKNNLFSFNRGEHFRRSAQGTESQIAWESSGELINPEFCIISRADIILASDSAAVSIDIESDELDDYSTAETDSFTISSDDLVCRTSQDIIQPLVFTDARQYFRATITTTENSYHEISKLIIGEWLDFDREPLKGLDYMQSKRTDNNYHSRQEFRFEFKGVANATRIKFYQEIDRYRNVKPVYIYDNDDVFLEGAKLAQVKITSVRYDIGFYDSNIFITCEEVY